jgi:hypothetical protein
LAIVPKQTPSPEEDSNASVFVNQAATAGPCTVIAPASFQAKKQTPVPEENHLVIRTCVVYDDAILLKRIQTQKSRREKTPIYARTWLMRTGNTLDMAF